MIDLELFNTTVETLFKGFGMSVYIGLWGIVLSLFIVGPRLQTLPVAIYRYVDERTDPMVAVLAVLLIAGIRPRQFLRRSIDGCAPPSGQATSMAALPRRRSPAHRSSRYCAKPPCG